MTNGLSLLELSELPAPWRAIIRLLMRDQPQTYAALATALEALPAQQRLVGDQFDEALAALCKEGYLVQQWAGDDRTYAMRIARKSGRAVSSSLWSALESDDSCDPRPSRAARQPRSNLLDSF